MDIEKEELERKIKDVEAIEFGDSLEDVSSSLLIVMTLFEVDDDPKVIKACKYKLFEGISLLKKLGDKEKASEIENKIKN
ncbi:hypothetical protein MATR_08800 [Marivirga tractuosa]|uniref:Uncharacterized protein n=1 Tax=Marivirga tractuosa (strain ATCC 23168 / DSM 4126 / NBRC 15989 / NCIMB 1408 / VKM B-1430 / H-43) TaxID=643867 RepID=E4TNQ4_MARTH|nr:hypothetical protein [Marivirga tractuosa]ADR21491.1 hypothetical protein Ftrac_1501 [Marivirga tractuosa DSM 4126]BDD14055.1 hypothetical protein MATR_08800 [Marivirga tractuosa]